MHKQYGFAKIFCLVALASSNVWGGDSRWLKVQSANFLLIGNASEKAILQAGLELEEFHAAVARFWPDTQKVARKPVVVMVFRDEGAFRPFAPAGGRAADVAGYFLAGEDLTYICLNLSAGRRLNSVVFHEYVHELLQNLPGRVPIWADEGLAEYYCTLESIDRGRKVKLGKAIAEHLQVLRRFSLLPVDRLMKADDVAFRAESKRTRSLHYAQAWLLVHFLMHAENGIYRQRFIRYLSATYDLAASEADRIRQALGLDFSSMQKALDKYLHQHSFPTETIESEEGFDSHTVLKGQPVNESEVQAQLGTLLLTANRGTEAEAYLTRALELDPLNAEARASLGILCFHQQKLDEAGRQLKQAVSSPGVRPVAHYYFVRSVIETAGVGTLLSENHTAKRDFIRKHLRMVLDGLPRHADSCHLLASLNLVFNEEIEESLELAQRAVALDPDQKPYLLTLAQLQIRRRHYGQARSILKSLLDSELDDSLRRLALQADEELKRAEFSDPKAGIQTEAGTQNQP